MDNYVPLFSKIMDSSVWREPDHVRLVFLVMLLKMGRGYVVRMTEFALGCVAFPTLDATKAEGLAVDALRVLSSPDTRRLVPQPFEGRRVERVEDGWLVLNGEKYQNEMRAMNDRARKRNWAAKNRAVRGKPLPGETAFVKAAEAGASEDKLDQMSAPGDERRVIARSDPEVV